MSIPGLTQPQPQTTAARRRWRVGGMTLVLVLAGTISVIVLNILAAKPALRWDLTAAGEHRLSPRTAAVLARVSQPHEIIVAGPLSDRAAVDPEAWRRTRDVLARIGDESRAHISATIIDTGTGEGLRRYQDLLTRLAEREGPAATTQVETLSAAAATAEQLAAALEALSPKLQAIREAIPEDSPGAPANRAYFEQRAAEARVSARSLREIAGKAAQLLATPIDPLPLPDTEQAAGLLRPAFGEVHAGLAAIADNLRRFAGLPSAPAGGAADAARGLADEAARLRDQAGIARDALDRLPRLDLPRIASVLRSGSAVLVVGPAGKGLTAVEFGDILPPGSPGPSLVDRGRVAEELLSAAIASLVAPARPIVVLLHAQTRAAVERLPFFDAISQLLAMRGVDILLWPVAESDTPPPTTRLDPQGNRPVVYVVFNTAGFTGGPTGQTGQERLAKLARAIESLARDGKPLLLSVLPSNAPSYGDKDPTTAFLAPLGLEVDAGRPLLREFLTPEGRRVEAFQRLQPEAGDHPILRAIRGLPTRLEWPIPMRPASPAPPGITITPLYSAAAQGGAVLWAESQWLALFQVPISQHAGITNAPTPDSRDDTAGPWVLAAAVEVRRPAAEGGPASGAPQRLVVVGSNSWFTDPVLREPMQVEGRIVAANPGNAELFEAAVYWLAGQDDLIAQSATARAAPIIKAMPEGLQRMLQLLAIFGLPALVLAAGVVYRVWRG
ncbi:MAG: hypothetical protein WD749_09175 [Phycisphaerales bacterium]